MSYTKSDPTRLVTIRTRLRATRDARAERNALARDLAMFEQPAELIELSAMLARYGDAETETIRRSVNWFRACGAQ